MSSDPVRVTDDTGLEFVLGPVIAAGAQGTVYRVLGDPSYAIKLLSEENTSALDRIAAARRLPLDGLPISAPLTLIRQGGNGYLMRLAADMAPLREPYLPREFTPRQTTASWYVQTGGLRRRLAIAANVAQALAALHERGLAYVDLNPGNVMVSDDLSRTETWLIDTDNLTSRTRPNWEVMGFPGYVAPERLIRKAPPSTLADAYILAVHVFRLLVLAHPLDGEATALVSGDEARGLMDTGAVPYVADPEDSSNRLAPRSLPAGLQPLVLSSEMRKLFEQTFGVGRLDPTKRPGAARWRDVLKRASDQVIECHAGCGWAYFRNAPKCPSCGSVTPPMPIVQIDASPVEGQFKIRSSFVVQQGSAVPALPRHLWGRHNETEPVFTVQNSGGELSLIPHGDARITARGGVPVTSLQQAPAGKHYRLRVEATGRPERFLTIRWLQPA